jgi:hypothetical protein
MLCVIIEGSPARMTQLLSALCTVWKSFVWVCLNNSTHRHMQHMHGAGLSGGT